MKTLIVISLLILAGCTSTGVVPMGPDSYMISKQGSGGWTSMGKLTAEIMKEANKYCTSIQKKLMPVSTQAFPAGFGRLPEAQVQFMCLTDNDYELKRPKMQPVPDVVIENRY